MTKWEKDVENKITTYWTGSNPDLVAEYKLESNVSWSLIGNMSDIGAKLYSVAFTFINTGKFMIRVRDTNTDVSIFEKLEVIETIETKGFV